MTIPSSRHFPSATDRAPVTARDSTLDDTIESSFPASDPPSSIPDPGPETLTPAAAIFALIFKTVPDAEVAWKDVRVGAIVTAILFTAGRLGLGWYLGRKGGDSAYAAATSLLALLAWVYYSSQLVLFGAEFTYAYACRYGSRSLACQIASEASAQTPALPGEPQPHR